MSDGRALVEVEDLKVYFPIHQGQIIKRHIGDIKAVDGVTFSIRDGETLGLVGESGCGKSTLGKAILRLLPVTYGRVRLMDTELTVLKRQALRRQRLMMQMVFQDPVASLNPRMTIGKLVEEPLIVHSLYETAVERKAIVADLLEKVGLDPSFVNRYPSEFSGGQRQRICIARALAVRPRFIVCDEPISELDVSIQAQIINLLQDLQSELNLTYLFIAHDLSVLYHISDRVAVMYLGKLVELSSKEELYSNSLHPYTQALLSAVPVPDPVIEEQRKPLVMEGDLPSPADPPKGCNFCTRCPKVMDICYTLEPDFKEQTDGHFTACHIYGRIAE